MGCRPKEGYFHARWIPKKYVLLEAHPGVFSRPETHQNNSEIEGLGSL